MKSPSLAACAARAAFCLGLAGAAPLVAHAAQPGTPVVLDAQEQAFVAKASADSTMQVTLAKLAPARSSSDRVKALARRVVHDHTDLNNQLSRYTSGKKSVGQAHGMTPRQMTAAQWRLKQLHGSAFDQEFARLMVSEHEQIIPLYRKAEKTLNHARLREIARAALPLLQQHLDEARTILRSAPSHALHPNARASRPTGSP